MIQNKTLLQDRYLVEKQIGAGGMGAVYLAVDQRFGSYVAIKETFYKNDEFGDAFEREAHLLNSLLHPVLPHVSDFFTENNGHFLVMQFIEGEDLSAILKREGAFPVKDVLRWTDNLLDALDYLHSHEPPIIHRDIKPQNLKITPRGDIILLDFGLAKLSSDDTLNEQSVFGYSRKYSPLEQIQGTGTDERSDIFALAATAFHLLTGKPPLDAIARAYAIIAGNSDPLPLSSELNHEIPVAVAEILHSALALNPAQRFVSAKAMRNALESVTNAGSIENNEESPVEAAALITSNEQIPGSLIVNSSETENFTALEAFAETIENVQQLIEEEKEKEIPVSIPNNESPLPVSYADKVKWLFQKDAVNDSMTLDIQPKPEPAAESDSIQNIEELPVPALAAVPAEDKVINSPKNEDVPAFEPYADKVKRLLHADAGNNSTTIDASARKISVPNPQIDVPSKVDIPPEINIPPKIDIPSPETEISAPRVETPLPRSRPAPELFSFADTETVVSPSRKQSKFPITALAAILICVGLAAAYFINRPNLPNENKANLPNESNQTAVVQAATTNPDNAQNEAISYSSIPDSGAPAPEIVRQPESAPVKNKTTAGKQEIAGKPETSGKQEAVEKRRIVEKSPAPPETTDMSKIKQDVVITVPAPKIQPRQRAETARQSQTQPTRASQSETVPDIETIFTGRPSVKRSAKPRSGEEQRQRQNNQHFPPF